MLKLIPSCSVVPYSKMLANWFCKSLERFTALLRETTTFTAGVSAATGVGSGESVACWCVYSHSVVSDSLRPHGRQAARLLCLWYFPGKNTEVGCHVLLQGIFPTKGSNPCLLCLLHWQVGSLPLTSPGTPPIDVQWYRMVL